MKNYDNNILGAIILLNTLNLTLEGLKIYDKAKNNVGEVSFYDGKVKINAAFNDNQIEATYNIPNVKGFKDKEDDNATFLELRYDINFSITSSIGTLKGKYLIDAHCDSKLGNGVSFHPQLFLENGNKLIDFSLLRGGLFKLYITDGEKHAQLTCHPFDDMNGYFIHRVYEEDPNSQEKESWLRKRLYDKYSSVTPSYYEKDDTNYQLLKLNIENDVESVTFREYRPFRKGRQHFIDIGNFINEIDPEVRKTISNFRKLLNHNDYLLFDNLMAIALIDYCDDECFEALFGFKRPSITFQDGSKSLEELFFGDGRIDIADASRKRISN